MKKTSLILLVIAIASVGWWFIKQQSTIEATLTPMPSNTMKLTSSAFSHNGPIPKEYTCDGAGEHPPLQFSGVPPEAQSLVLIVDDPDAPRGTWTHWLVWNIDPKTIDIKAGEVPPGAMQGKTSSGENHWGPPCPPSGTHHYHFKLFALDEALSIATSAEQKELETALSGHVLDQSELVGLYARGK